MPAQNLGVLREPDSQIGFPKEQSTRFQDESAAFV
jgi:hypothetical protein